MPSPEHEKSIELMDTVRKKRRAAELRLKKVAYSAIADELGVSIGTVRLWVKELIVTMLPPEETEELRAMEAHSIDESEQRSLMAMEMLRIQAQRKQDEEQPIFQELEELRKWDEHLASLRKQRALLLGLNKPVKVEHTLKVRTEFDEEVEQLTSQLLGGGKLLSLPDNLDVGDEIA